MKNLKSYFREPEGEITLDLVILRRRGRRPHERNWVEVRPCTHHCGLYAGLKEGLSSSQALTNTIKLIRIIVLHIWD